MEPTHPPRFLCLLPPAPTPVSAAALKATFGDTITRVLKQVSARSSASSKAVVLELALACPHLVGARAQTSRSKLYSTTQSVVAGVYRLVCLSAAKEDVNIEDADGVDVRVLLVAWDLDDSPIGPNPTPYGCVVDMLTLANCGRAWQQVFGVESEAGEKMVAAFTEAKGHSDELGHVRSGPAAHGDSAAHISTATDAVGSENSTHARHFDVAVGGTFDHLHIGHKLLITMTIFAVDERSDNSGECSATIGITGDQLLVNKKQANLVESWTQRQKAVATFFNAILDFSTPSTSGQRHTSIRDDPGPNGKSVDIHYPNGLVVKCTEIQDPFGPTITDEQISALIISAETRSGGKAVNDKRNALGWKELDVYEVDVLDKLDDDAAKDGQVEGFENKISSTAIRVKLAKKAGNL